MHAQSFIIEIDIDADFGAKPSGATTALSIFLGFDWPRWPERAFSWLATASVRAMP